MLTLTKKHKNFIQKPIKNTSNTALPLSFRLPIASAPHSLLQCCCERFAQALRCLFSSINVVRGVGTPRVDALDHAVCERTPRGLWQCARQQKKKQVCASANSSWRASHQWSMFYFHIIEGN
jgi:hypothetical protein